MKDRLLKEKKSLKEVIPLFSVLAEVKDLIELLVMPSVSLRFIWTKLIRLMTFFNSSLVTDNCTLLSFTSHSGILDSINFSTFQYEVLPALS